MKATFENSVNVLLQAYLNDTLEHGNCSACAVGNLIAHAIGTEPVKHSELHKRSDYDGFVRFKNGVKPQWVKLFVTPLPKSKQKISLEFLSDALPEIKATGYNWRQLASMERAFENADGFVWGGELNNNDRMFNGLMAVVDVLAEIHNVDLSVREEIKKPFIEQYSVRSK